MTIRAKASISIATLLVTSAASIHAQQPTCTDASQGLPPADNASIDAQYDQWQKICYADSRIWTEYNQVDFELVPKQLMQRMTFFRPRNASTASGTYPLIIWSHPAGSSEKIDEDDEIFLYFVKPALKKGYAFASIENRHPATSAIKAPGPTTGLIAEDRNDISRAVQYMKYHSATFKVDVSQVYLAGQSRGSLALMAAFDPPSGFLGKPGYKGQDPKVNAVFAYQAQTVYDPAQIASIFVDSGEQSIITDSYSFTTPPPDTLAVYDPAAGPKAYLVYRETPADAKNVTRQPQCLVVPQGYSWSGMQDPCDGDASSPKSPTLKKPADYFDIHDANYGVALKRKYLDSPARLQDGLTVCNGVSGGTEAGYKNAVPFFETVRSGTGAPPACVKKPAESTTQQRR